MPSILHLAQYPALNKQPIRCPWQNHKQKIEVIPSLFHACMHTLYTVRVQEILELFSIYGDETSWHGGLHTAEQREIMHAWKIRRRTEASRYTPTGRQSKDLRPVALSHLPPGQYTAH